MKKHLALAALVLLAFASLCAAQTQATASPSPSPAPKPRMSKAALLKKLSASDTKLWESWKNKDPKPFQMWLASDAVMISEGGREGKGDVTKEIAAMPCEVKSFSLSDWKLTMITPDAAYLTYKGSAEGTCAGQAIPTVWASSIWVNRKGKWLALSHQETPLMKP